MRAGQIVGRGGVGSGYPASFFSYLSIYWDHSIKKVEDHSSITFERSRKNQPLPRQLRSKCHLSCMIIGFVSKTGNELQGKKKKI